MEPFTDRNGRTVQVGNVLIWEARSGTVRAPVMRYDLLGNIQDNGMMPGQFIPEDMRRVVIVRLPDGRDAWLFAHQVAQMGSEAAK